MKEIKITGYQIKQILKWVSIGIPALFILYCGYCGIAQTEISGVWESWCDFCAFVIVFGTVVGAMVLIVYGIYWVVKAIDYHLDDWREFTIRIGKKNKEENEC